MNIPQYTTLTNMSEHYLGFETWKLILLEFEIIQKSQHHFLQTNHKIHIIYSISPTTDVKQNVIHYHTLKKCFISSNPYLIINIIIWYHSRVLSSRLWQNWNYLYISVLQLPWLHVLRENDNNYTACGLLYHSQSPVTTLQHSCNFHIFCEMQNCTFLF